MPKTYITIIIFAVLITRLFRCGLLDITVFYLNINLISYIFIAFSLVVPNIYIFKLVFSVLLRIQTSYEHKNLL